LRDAVFFAAADFDARFEVRSAALRAFVALVPALPSPFGFGLAVFLRAGR